MESSMNKDDEIKIVHTRTGKDLWDKIKPLARQMRREPTPAENILWQRLRNRQLGGYRFRQQQPIDRFIVDFYCSDAHLVVEVDGSIHQYTHEEDALRTEYLESLGLKVIRFTNDEIMSSLAVVLRTTLTELQHAKKAPSLRSGEGVGGEDDQW
jgi:very-short-patch-repair endonuclease